MLRIYSSLDATMNNILVTGGLGFIGSNFIPYFINKYSDYNIINLDKITYAADINSVGNISDLSRYKLIEGDICDRLLLESIFDKYSIKEVIHFAAETHVDNSINKPGIFIETNVLGTFNVLDVAKSFWMEGPFRYKPQYETCKFYHISTDEVYGTLGDSGYFTEKSNYAPNSPYSASKASSDMIVRSYNRTYGMNTLITNCSNNYGPNQHIEKFIPTIIKNAIKNKPIPIYGDGKNIRDWLYVLDHCKAIDAVFHNSLPGEKYNIGGKCERTNLDIANKICSILDKKIKPKKISSYKQLIVFIKDRAGHDRRYAVDTSKIETALGWTPEENFDSGIDKTVEWYLRKFLNGEK